MKRSTGAVALLVLTAAAWGCGSQPEPEEVVRPVRYEVVYASGANRERTFSGVSRSSTETELSFRVAGTIQELPIKVGDTVRRGDLIARLDPQDYELQVDEANAGVVRAEAEARNARANYNRIRALYEAQNASRTDLDQARTASESADAALVSARKRLELVRLQLGYTRINAPADGRIAAVPVTLNENVGVGQLVAILESGARAEIEVGIPGVLISQVNTGDETVARFDALPGRPFTAVVTKIGVARVGGATTFPVTVELQESSAPVRSGMAAEVTFRFASGQQQGRIFVPSVAVGEDRAGRFVYVVESQGEAYGIVHRREVTVGSLVDEGLEIVSGLAEGDSVVTAGVSRIRDDQKVRLLPLAR
jgi:RND family efflux transporter MFP subunit